MRSPPKKHRTTLAGEDGLRPIFFNWGERQISVNQKGNKLELVTKWEKNYTVLFLIQAEFSNT